MPVTRISASVDWSTNSGAGLWIGERRLVDDRAALVDRLADDVEDAAQGLRADRHRDRLAGIDDLGAAHQPVGRVHRDRAHGVLAEMLRHFEHQGAAAVVDVQRVQDRRQLAVEMDIDDGADDLGDRADRIGARWCSWPCPRSFIVLAVIASAAKQSSRA